MHENLSRRRTFEIALLISMFTILLILPASNLLGATLVVTKSADTNDGVCNVDCSLREAIEASNRSNTLIGSFSPNVNGTIEAIVVQSDGKIVIAGSFTFVNRLFHSYIARLNQDGSVDDSFDARSNNSVFKLLLQPDGKILVGGLFSQINGVDRRHLARINSNGSLDASFDPSPNGAVMGVAVQSDRKIIVGGNFTQISGDFRSRIARLNENGTIDTLFTAGADANVGDIAVQPDGHIIFEGQFSSINGITRNNLARLFEDGSLDLRFNPNPDFDAGANIEIQPDGKIIVGGSFNYVGGHFTKSIARLNPDGSADTSFTNELEIGAVRAVALQHDGKIVIVGAFGVFRFNSNGSIDLMIGLAASDSVNALAVEPNGDVVLGGEFLQFGGEPRFRAARLKVSITRNLIEFDPTIFAEPRTITLNNGDLFVGVGSHVTINGPGANLLTIDANDRSRAFYVNQNVSAQINGITIKGGLSVGIGGGILNRGELRLDRVVILRNRSSFGGGIFNEQGILSINNSTIRNNQSTVDGGGIFNANGSIELLNSTINNNSANFNGGGVVNNLATMKVVNSTIAGNLSRAKGGAFHNTSSTVNLNQVTVANNSANSGGGVFNSLDSEFFLKNSIIAENSALSGIDFWGSASSEGHNLFGDITDLTITGDRTGNIIGVSPKFDPDGLFDNGGSTQTLALLSISPAIDAANFEIGSGFDQRGVIRPQDGNGDGILESDMGSYEFDSYRARKSAFDFDGDGRSDISVIRKPEGTWFLLGSRNGLEIVNPGILSDNFVPADYDGDGITDVAVWHGNEEKTFSILQSTNGIIRHETFGIKGDDPSIVGDWDGDGLADLAVYRSATREGTREGTRGVFYFRGSSNNSDGNITFLPWGTTGDKPVGADVDGDGKFDAAIFRPSEGTWYVRRSSDLETITLRFGNAADKLVPADYDGDGKTDLGVYRPTDGTWYIQLSRDGLKIIQFGMPNDKPVPADYDGDGKADLAHFRNGQWFILKSSGGVLYQLFGLPTDLPVPGLFVR